MIKYNKKSLIGIVGVIIIMHTFILGYTLGHTAGSLARPTPDIDKLENSSKG